MADGQWTNRLPTGEHNNFTYTSIKGMHLVYHRAVQALMFL